MKTKLMILSVMALILTAGDARAEGASLEIGALKGEFQLVDNARLVKAEAMLYCHWCGIGSCAASNTSATERLPLKLTRQGQLVRFETGAGEMATNKWFKKLHYCSVDINLEVDKPGKKIAAGTFWVVRSDKPIEGETAWWQDKDATRNIQRKLTQTRIQLEYRESRDPMGKPWFVTPNWEYRYEP